MVRIFSAAVFAAVFGVAIVAASQEIHGDTEEVSISEVIRRTGRAPPKVCYKRTKYQDCCRKKVVIKKTCHKDECVDVMKCGEKPHLGRHAKPRGKDSTPSSDSTASGDDVEGDEAEVAENEEGGGKSGSSNDDGKSRNGDDKESTSSGSGAGNDKKSSSRMYYGGIRGYGNLPGEGYKKKGSCYKQTKCSKVPYDCSKTRYYTKCGPWKYY